VGIDPAVQAGEDATKVGDPTKIAQLTRFGWIIFLGELVANNSEIAYMFGSFWGYFG
jgi:hypothetical protein